MNELIKKLYYAALDTKEIEYPKYQERLNKTNEIVEQKCEAVRKFAPAALVNELRDAFEADADIYGEQMFLLGLRSAVAFLEGMTGTEEIEF